MNIRKESLGANVMIYYVGRHWSIIVVTHMCCNYINEK